METKFKSTRLRWCLQLQFDLDSTPFDMMLYDGHFTVIWRRITVWVASFGSWTV